MKAMLLLAVPLVAFAACQEDQNLAEGHTTEAAENEPIQRVDIGVCDQDANRYENASTARIAGLTEAEFGATYCPEYKMHPSWDANSNGINDCEEENTCSADYDYMSPRG